MPVYLYDEVTSTNDIAKQLADKGIPLPFAVRAVSQTAGRGQHGRSFFSGRDAGMYLSVVFEPRLPSDRSILITPYCGLCVRRAVWEKYGIRADLKYVNDVMVSGKKIAGILTEAVSDGGKMRYAVCGIGLNVKKTEMPDAIKDIAASLEDFCGHAEVEEITEHILRIFGNGPCEEDEKDIVREYKEALLPVNMGDLPF